MTQIAFDTLKFAKNLRAQAHFTPAQAESLAEAFADATKEQIVLKPELDSKEYELSNKDETLHRDIIKLDAKIDKYQEINNGKFSLLQWMLGFTLAVSVALLWVVIRK